MSRKLVSVVTCLAMTLAGCGVDTKARTVQKLSPRDAPSMARAAWNGRYTLYSVSGGNNPVRTSIRSGHLRKGEPVGFRVREGGLVVAVAGDTEVAVWDGTYEWVMQADAGQTDPGATAVLIVVVVAVVAGIATIVFLVALQDALHHLSFGAPQY